MYYLRMLDILVDLVDRSAVKFFVRGEARSVSSNPVMLRCSGYCSIVLYWDRARSGEHGRSSCTLCVLQRR